MPRANSEGNDHLLGTNAGGDYRGQWGCLGPLFTFTKSLLLRLAVRSAQVLSADPAKGILQKMLKEAFAAGL